MRLTILEGREPGACWAYYRQQPAAPIRVKPAGRGFGPNLKFFEKIKSLKGIITQCRLSSTKWVSHLGFWKFITNFRNLRKSNCSIKTKPPENLIVVRISSRATTLVLRSKSPGGRAIFDMWSSEKKWRPLGWSVLLTYFLKISIKYIFNIQLIHIF